MVGNVHSYAFWVTVHASADRTSSIWNFCMTICCTLWNFSALWKSKLLWSRKQTSKRDKFKWHGLEIDLWQWADIRWRWCCQFWMWKGICRLCGGLLDVFTKAVTVGLPLIQHKKLYFCKSWIQQLWLPQTFPDQWSLIWRVCVALCLIMHHWVALWNCLLINVVSHNPWIP